MNTDTRPERRSAWRPAQQSSRICGIVVESRALPALPGTRRGWPVRGAPVASYHFRSERWVNLLSLQLFPVDLTEQGVLADVPPHSQPVLGLPHEELRRSREGTVTSPGTGQLASEGVAFLSA